MSTYVYCFARASHPLPIADTAGVGSPASPVRVVRESELTAVVSDAPADLRGKRRDLETHSKVVSRLFAAGTVLPMRFGMVAADDDAVRADLRASARRYGELLSRLDSHVEFNVKGVHQEDVVLRDMLLGNRDLFEQNAALQAAGGGSRQDKLAFGERVAGALEKRRSRDAESAIARLQTHAGEVRRGPQVDGCFVNVSFLVASGAQRDFEASLFGLREELRACATVNLYGPLPPYTFVGNDRNEQGR